MIHNAPGIVRSLNAIQMGNASAYPALPYIKNRVKA